MTVQDIEASRVEHAARRHAANRAAAVAYATAEAVAVELGLLPFKD